MSQVLCHRLASGAELGTWQCSQTFVELSPPAGIEMRISPSLYLLLNDVSRDTASRPVRLPRPTTILSVPLTSSVSPLSPVQGRN